MNINYFWKAGVFNSAELYVIYYIIRIFVTDHHGGEVYS